jgi:hypothetical protein
MVRAAVYICIIITCEQQHKSVSTPERQQRAHYTPVVMHMMWLKNVIIRGMQGSKTEKCFICAGRKKREFMESAAGLWHAALRAFGISAAVVL